MAKKQKKSVAKKFAKKSEPKTVAGPIRPLGDRVLIKESKINSINDVVKLTEAIKAYKAHL